MMGDSAVVSDRGRTGVGLLPILGLAAAGAAILPFGSEVRAVLLPMLAGALFLFWFVLRLSQLSGTTPVGDVGAWYVVAGTVYLLLPLIVYLVLGMVFIPTSDGRLFALQPDPYEVARIGWMYVVHTIAFGCAYLAIRGEDRGVRPIRQVRRRTVIVGLAMWALLTAALFGVKAIIPRPENYADSYAVVASLPLAVRQTLKLIFGVNFVLTILLLVAAFEDYRKWRWLILAWLVFQVVVTVTTGIRTGLVLSFCACMILYHRKVRAVPMLTAAVLTTFAVLIFLGLGILRNYQGAERRSDFTVAPSGGEFEALFANAVDIDRRHTLGEIDGAPPGAYLADIVAPVPSQLLPFEKVDLATWYVSRFYPTARDEGRAYAFGVIAQSALGFGWIELIARGLILGLVLAKTHRFFRRHSANLWVVVFYVWLVVSIYQSFRDTSFSVWTSFIQQFLPSVVLVESLAAIFARVSQTSLRGAKQHVAPTSG